MIYRSNKYLVGSAVDSLIIDKVSNSIKPYIQTTVRAEASKLYYGLGSFIEVSIGAPIMSSINDKIK